MQVSLAGYNIDSSLINGIKSDNATPEVISAAYARISRSPKSVTELRREALLELEKARRSNTRIIFDLGHASIAEHAGFNFDIIGISRLLTDTLETVRLASFTEKSQRYVTLSKDYVVPQELEAQPSGSLKSTYLQVMDALFAEYAASQRALTKDYAQRFPDLKPVERECLAKEDARYILPLATKTQLGMTINARSLENLLRRLSESPLLEARELREALLCPVSELCPSLIRHTESDSFTGTFSPGKLCIREDSFAPEESVRALDITEDADGIILTALLWEQTEGDFQACREALGKLDASARNKLWREVFAQIRPWHKLRRAFELADFSFELHMSESCWAQFTRHRIGTIIRQTRPSQLSYTLPQAILDIGRDDDWDRLLDRARELRENLARIHPALANYTLLNASKVKVLARMNLRELYHFVRLRSDEHAQWEIRGLSHSLVDQLRVFAPRATAWLCGKSEMPETAEPQRRD